MKRLNLLFLFIVLSIIVVAQDIPQHAQYVKLGSSVAWYSAYENWQPGTSLYNGTEDADNEQFFISRVKPRKRFNFTATQVKEELNPERKLLWWAPLGNIAYGNCNSLPSYWFSGEVYSMWSYTDVFSDFSTSLIQVPAAFLDVCHKNGVRSGAVLDVPYAMTPSEGDGKYGSCIATLYNGGSEKLLKYLRYYGVDGIALNSEFSWNSLNMNSFRTLMSSCYESADAYGVPFNNVWLDLIANGGYLTNYPSLCSSNSEWFEYNGKTISDVFTLYYGANASQLSSSQSFANSLERSSFDVYAGVPFILSYYAQWSALKDYEISIALHNSLSDMNMLYETCAENGSDPLVKQKTYQLISENTFTGSFYNPVNTPEITDQKNSTSKVSNFHGISSFITARSTMMAQYGDATLADDPFVTYFNLGNGMFFNDKGETTFNKEWYNLGMQDYLPTWRWWWTKNFMGKNATDASTDMVAEFTWDDAWFGGSCLQITGATQGAYLQLFKTKYELQNNDIFTVRYKIVSGEGSVKLTTSTEANPTLEISSNITSNIDIENDSWIEKKIKVGVNGLDLNGETLALIGLKFENTSDDFKLLIGEISLNRGTSVTPGVPKVISSSAMQVTYNGVDAKIIFDMSENYSGSRQLYETIYNSDVDTWFYKIYTQQEGEEPVLCTSTSSWAAYVVGAPYNTMNGGKFRIGVSAVSMDGNSESNIAWGEYLELPEVIILDGISIDKPVVKANEEFTVTFDDPKHPAATWIIKASDNDEVIATFNATSFTTSLPEEGIYDIYLKLGDKTKIYRGKIQISSIDVGAMPQIESFTIDENDKDGTAEFSYVGREDSNGYISRGMVLAEKAFGIPASQLNFGNEQEFTLSFWFKVNKFYHQEEGTQFLNIRSPLSQWPGSDYGYIYSQFTSNKNEDNIAQEHKENGLNFCFRSWNGEDIQKVDEEIIFEENVWYHIAFVFGYTNNRTLKIYLNGKEIHDYTSELEIDSWYSSNVIMIGGPAYLRGGLDGMLDEVCLYNRALSQEEVKESMKRATNITDESFIGYWDFESDENENNELVSSGYNKSLIAGYYDPSIIENRQYAKESFIFKRGVPFISGTNYKVETLPTWNFRGGCLLSSVGDNANGNASVAYSDGGAYSATLTLSNYWGSDTKQIEFVVSTGIEDVTLDEMRAFPNPFENEVYLKFNESGNYTIELYDYTGRLINSSLLTPNEGEIVNVPVNGESGIYFVKVKGYAGLLKVMKVIKR